MSKWLLLTIVLVIGLYFLLNPYKVDTYECFKIKTKSAEMLTTAKYLYGSIGKRYGSTSLTETTAKKNETAIVKNLGIILGTINFLFIIIMHILLQYFSTDG